MTKEITINIKSGEELSKKEIKSWDRIMKKTFNSIPLEKESYKNKIFFMVKKNNQITALGLLIPIKINYLNKSYSILGSGNITTIIRKKGYGKILIASMANYLKEKNKTGVGFCSYKTLPFYKKVGLSVKRDLTKNRFYFKTNNKEKKDKLKRFHRVYSNIIYFNAKDNFMKKVLLTKSKVEIPYSW